MSRLLIALTLAVTVFSVSWIQEASEDRIAVDRAVRDYVEAIYRVKPELITRSVHPGLHKQGLYRQADATSYGAPIPMNFEQLKTLASRWNANEQQGADLKYEVKVLDMLDVTASAKLTASWGIDYMQLMKQDGKWKIVQIIWQSHPREK